jgi:para-nitrobenzyl esterase
MNALSKLIASATVTALVSSAAIAETAKMKIDSGTLVGAAQDGVKVFKGVPFAQPPVGELRWAPPKKPASWKGDRDATRFSLPCSQPVNADGSPNGGGVTGANSEDCLYLNVWAPANAKNAPVMVWLYGGGAFLGAGHLGSFDGSSFARDGVVVVTINYRLGSFGYFAHPALTKAAKPDEVLGNYALLDAIQALGWVKRNIATVGGDTNNVTLFGQSAGGAMVVNLLGAPHVTKGLFQKAIIESGAVLRAGNPLPTAEANVIKALATIGVPENATLAQLRAIPEKQLVEAEATRRGFAGIIDGRLMRSAAVDMFKAGTALDVPVIVGTNNGEGGADSAQIVAAAESPGAASFLYQFQHVPAWRTMEQPKGAIHSAELPYVFDSWETSGIATPKFDDADKNVAKKMHSCWVAFAKSPVTMKSLNCADGFVWPAYTTANDAVATFSAKPEVKKAASLPKFVPTPST